MRSMSPRNETMSQALDRVGAALDKAYAEYCRPQATIAKLAAGPPWYHIVTQIAAPEGAFFMELN
jgi:hypothetical protein